MPLQYNEQIPLGKCQCGCGKGTTLIERNDFRAGKIKGTYALFVSGHSGKMQSKSKNPYLVIDMGYFTPCWIWQRNISGTYGRLYANGRLQQAHRVYYEKKYGLVPDGFEMDHKCRVRTCVNPDHSLPETHTENVRLGLIPKLSLSKVEWAFSLRSQGVSKTDIALLMGVHPSTIHKALSGATWR